MNILQRLVLLLVCSSMTVSAADEPRKQLDASSKGSKHVDLHSILEAGKAAHSLPPDVVIRVQAKLGRATFGDPKARTEAEARGVDFTTRLEESWEFTTNEVYRVLIETPDKQGQELVYRRVESRLFDSKNLCAELLDCRIFEIGDDHDGECRQFVGTDYNIGHRTVEILMNGRSALWVGETCLSPGYHEKDAVAFAALYERLATQARAVFQATNR